MTDSEALSHFENRSFIGIHVQRYKALRCPRMAAARQDGVYELSG